MGRLPAALVLLVFLAALGAGATLCGPQRAAAETSECCPSQEPAPSDLGCAPVCQTCAVLPAPARIAIAAPAAALTQAGAESTLSGFRPPVEHVPLSLA
jgi:hypothetical protein